MPAITSAVLAVGDGFWSFHGIGSSTVPFCFSGVCYCKWTYTWGSSNQSFWQEGSSGALREWPHTATPEHSGSFASNYWAKWWIHVYSLWALYYCCGNLPLSLPLLSLVAIIFDKFDLAYSDWSGSLKTGKIYTEGHPPRTRRAFCLERRRE